MIIDITNMPLEALKKLLEDAAKSNGSEEALKKLLEDATK